MTEYVIPTISIVGMVFTAILSVSVPVALLIHLKKRSGAGLLSFFVGCATFVLFALVLEQFLHSFMLTRFAEVFQTNVWLYALYGGAAAAVFEEFGRLFAMGVVLRKKLSKQNALMYGAGHGGIEAIIIAGASMVSNIIYSVQLNSGAFDALLASGDADALATATMMCGTQPAMFFISGIERLIAITLHIVLSYFVYRAVKDKKPLYFLLALFIHFAVDAAAVVLSNLFSVYLLELVLIVLMAVLVYIVMKMYRAEKAEITVAETPVTPVAESAE